MLRRRNARAARSGKRKRSVGLETASQVPAAMAPPAERSRRASNLGPTNTSFVQGQNSSGTMQRSGTKRGTRQCLQLAGRQLKALSFPSRRESAGLSPGSWALAVSDPSRRIVRSQPNHRGPGCHSEDLGLDESMSMSTAGRTKVHANRNLRPRAFSVATFSLQGSTVGQNLRLRQRQETLPGRSLSQRCRGAR